MSDAIDDERSGFALHLVNATRSNWGRSVVQRVTAWLSFTVVFAMLSAHVCAECPPFIDRPFGNSGNPLGFIDNGCAEMVYDYWDGQLFLDAEWGPVTTLEMRSSSGVFTGECSRSDPPFEQCTPTKVFALDPSGSRISGGNFVAYMTPRLDYDILNEIPPLTVSVSFMPSAQPIDMGSWSTHVSLDEARSYIDSLTQTINAGVNDTVVRLVLDFDDDGLVNQADRTIWITDIARTFFGDSNLDGEFNSGDLVTVFTAGEYEDAMDDNSVWAEGDWDGDRDFTSGDLVVAFHDGGYEQGSRSDVNAVPEPTSLAMVMAALMFAARVTRRRGSLT